MSQTAAPVRPLLLRPTGHASHAMAPGRCANRPMAHGAQLCIPNDPAKVPALQEEHIDAPDTFTAVPGLHWRQLVDRVDDAY
jgi:hypothetical protein